MRAERLPCRLSTPSQAHLQGPQRLWREAYRRRSCCLITFFLPPLPPLSISGCHSHLHSFTTPSFIYLSLFQRYFPFSTLIFPDLWGKGPRWHQRRGLRHAKWKMHTHTYSETAPSRSNGSPVCSHTHIHLWPLMLLLLLSLLTCMSVDHQSMHSGWICLPIQTANRDFM